MLGLAAVGPDAVAGEEIQVEGQNLAAELEVRAAGAREARGHLGVVVVAQCLPS